MAITSLKPIKTKNSKEIVNGRQTETANHVGYTKAEARGIFGGKRKPSKLAAKRIKDYERRHAEAELKRYKRIHAGVPAKMGERQEKAMARIMELDYR